MPDLMVVDAVERWYPLVVDVDLVWLHRTSYTHYTQVVLELEPALTAPDKVYVRRHKVRKEDFIDG